MAAERPRRNRVRPTHFADYMNGDESEGTARASLVTRRTRSSSMRGLNDTSGGGEDWIPDKSRASDKSAAPPLGSPVAASASYKFYEKLVADLLDDDRSDGFHKPVTDLWEDEAIPEYTDIIKEPMDLGTIMMSLQGNKYVRRGQEGPLLDEEAVVADIQLVFNNCMEYNTPGSDFFVTAEILLKEIEQKVAPRFPDKRRKGQKKALAASKSTRRRGRPKSAKPEKGRDGPHQKNKKRRTVQQKLRSSSEEVQEVEQIKEICEVQTREMKEEEDRREAVQGDKEAAHRSSVNLYGEQKGTDESAIQESAEATVSKKETNRKETKTGTDLEKGVTARLQPTASPSTHSHLTDDEQQQVERELQLRKLEKQVQEQRRALRALSLGRSGKAPKMDSDMEEETVESGIAGMRRAALHRKTVSDIVFRFVSTKGLRQDAERRNAAVRDLEELHARKVAEWRRLINLKLELNERKKVCMTRKEKEQICADVQKLDYKQMAAVVDMLARGMNNSALHNETMVEVDVERVGNGTLREIQMYMTDPSIGLSATAVRDAEKEIFDIETMLVCLSFVSDGTDGEAQ